MFADKDSKQQGESRMNKSLTVSKVTREVDMIHDARLSWTAKLLMGYLLILPGNPVDLIKQDKDTTSLILRGLNELIQHGYLC
jgi:hypothetical protein